MNQSEIIDWLLDGDISIQYQVYRDLLHNDRKDIQKRIATEGWGKQLLDKRRSDGQWGRQFYQPKWTSTHYTLLDLRNLNIYPGNEVVLATVKTVLRDNKAADGGIRVGPSTDRNSDVCINGMFLNYASYFGASERSLHSLVDCVLDAAMPDGGFNCWHLKKGTRHSSLHSTLSVLEGMSSFLAAGFIYRAAEIKKAIHFAEEFMLMHRLFLSDRTGKIINRDFLRFTYPCRWKYDVLRALDYFQNNGSRWDERMAPAMQVILEKRKADGRWLMQAAHPGKVHFVMEKPGQPSRWNTLRALRVMRRYKGDNEWIL